jgi:Fic family protein
MFLFSGPDTGPPFQHRREVREYLPANFNWRKTMDEGNRRARNTPGPLFEIRARTEDPITSHTECERQNNELTASMIYALNVIANFPGLTAKEMEKKVNCEAGTIWKVVAQLERRGFVYRKKLPQKKGLSIFPLLRDNIRIVEAT